MSSFIASLPFRWINHDGKLIILSRGICTFARSYIAIIIALYLDKLGFSLIQVGLFLSTGVAGAAFFAKSDTNTIRVANRIVFDNPPFAPMSPN